MATRPKGYWHRAIRGGLNFLRDQTLTDAEQAQALANLGVVGPMQTLYHLIGADMNATSDQPFTKLHDYPAWCLLNYYVANPSISLTTAVGGLYTGAAKSGITLVAASQAWSALNATGAGLVLTAATPLGRGRITADPILSLTTPQGVAATCDIYVMGFAVA